MLPLVDECYIYYDSYISLRGDGIVYLMHKRNNYVQIDTQVDSTSRVYKEAHIHLGMP